MRNQVLAVVAAATLGLANVPVIAHAADAGQTATQKKLTATGHNPGNPGFSVKLPADLKYETADGKTATHPCAGRKMSYHSHSDALYATHVNDELTLMAVDGSEVVPMDSICFRLAPDADSKGNEVSRYVVTEGSSFLGTPGDTVWLAPQDVAFMEQWRPLWAGLGAFDPKHEAAGKVPTNFKDDLVHFEMKGISGPGNVHIFRYEKFGDKYDRYFDSGDPQKQSFSYKVGAHGHFNWAFTKPGIYAVQWQAKAERTDGTTETSELMTQYWLVGDDATVGLKEGTTTELNEIKKTVDGKPLPKPSATTTTTSPSTSAQPTTTASPFTSAQSSATAEPTTSEPVPGGEGAGVAPTREPETSAPEETAAPQGQGSGRCEAAHVLSTKPDAFITSGHMDLGLERDNGTITARLHDDSDPAQPAQRESGTFLFEVGDKARTEIPDSVKDSFLGEYGEMWILPQVQDQELPWLGFSTTGLGPNSLEPESKVKVTMKDVAGPGDIVTWHESMTSLRKELDSRDPKSSLTYGSNDHDHQSFGFSKPGLYAATFVYTGKAADGTDFSKELRAHFAVGQKAIAEARAHRDNGYADLPASQDCAAAGQGQGTAGNGESQSQWDRLINAVEGIGRDVTQIGSLLGGKTGATPANPAVPTAPVAQEGAPTANPQWEAFFRASGSLATQALGHTPAFEWFVELKLAQNLATSVANLAGSAAPEGESQDSVEPAGSDASAPEAAAEGEPEAAPQAPAASPEGNTSAAAPVEAPAAPAAAPAPGQASRGVGAVSAGSSASGHVGSSSPAVVAQAGSDTSADSGTDSSVESVESVDQADGGEDIVPGAEPGAEADNAATGGGIVSSIDGQKPGPKQYDAASQGRTAGGFWAGLAFGFGAMALIGGGVLFSAAWKALRDVNGVNADLVGKRSSR